MSYLTREQATAELVRSGSTPEGAAKLLDNALGMYPQSVRTNFDLITGYPARMFADRVWDRFTISPW
jgi:hypothetical protein